MHEYWNYVDPGSFLQGDKEGYNKPVRIRYRKVLRELGIQSVLEVGCGPGVDCMGALAVNPKIRYTGVDITPQMVEHCRKLYPQATFLVADIYKLPFENQSFELVYCKDVLNHLKYWKKAFKELRRISGKYVLMNFFHGLGKTTVKGTFIRDGYMDNYYDWNEVMTTLVSFRPAALTAWTMECSNGNEETMILFQKEDK